MRVRTFELRLLAVTLSILWIASSFIVLLGYRPGGPVDLLVGIAASLPLPVSLAAVIWPPLVRSGRAMAAVIWLGVVAALLLIPSIAGVAVQIANRTSEPLLPSLEIVYPWLLALAATALFAGLGVTRIRSGEVSVSRRRLVRSIAFAAATTSIISVCFAGVSLANDAALRDKPALHSRFGPTAATPEPPACDGTLALAQTARLELSLSVRVDNRPAGDLAIYGVRSGSDTDWTGEIVKPDLLGAIGVVRKGTSAWLLEPHATWRVVQPADVADQTLDAIAIPTLLTAGNRATAEDHGLEFVEGARARHCRISVDGPLFVAAFPQIQYLIGDAKIDKWRGEVDYWVFSDAEVGKIVGSVNGDAAQILPHGIQATAEVTMNAVDRGAPVSISGPR